MICWTTVSLLLIVVPPFASITEEKQTVRKGEDVHLLCVNSRSQDEVVWVTPERCKDDSLYIDKNVKIIFLLNFTRLTRTNFNS